MGKFKSGNPRPQSSGRKKGQPNRRTVFLKSLTQDLGLDVPQRLGELLPNLEPAKQADVLLELMGYIYPKRKAIEHTGLEGAAIQVQTRREDIVKVLRDADALAALELVEDRLKEVGSGSDS